jgi:hypothetical protein
VSPTLIDRRTARELEEAAAAEPAPSSRPRVAAPSGEAVAMLVRRGFAPSFTAPDVPFDPELPEPEAERLAAALDRYAFRLFLRGAIQRPDGFSPEEATRFLTPEHAAERAAQAAALGLAERLPGGRYRLLKPACSFGGTLEWYVARRLRGRFALDVIAGVNFHAPGVGGDLDVVAAGEGKLVVLELKSSPPKRLGEEEVGAFFDRLRALRPHVAIFAVDTALRLADKAIPLLAAALGRRSTAAHNGASPFKTPRRVERDLWALTPHIYAVNAKPDLVANIGRALAEGLGALAPDMP